MIKSVHIMPNGMVVVFDQDDNQLASLQGIMFEVLNRIVGYADKNTNFYLGSTKMDIAWYFDKYQSSASKAKTKNE